MALTHTEKKSLIKNLLDLALVDDNYHVEELRFIGALAEGVGISEMELEEIKNEEIAFVPPKKEFDRIEHMHRLMLLMASDQTFSKIEKEFIQNIGLRMGIRPQATISLMNMLEESPNNILSPEEIIAVYNTYYN